MPCVPKRKAVPPGAVEKPLPVIVRRVPPALVPVSGLTLVTVGDGRGGAIGLVPTTSTSCPPQHSV